MEKKVQIFFKIILEVIAKQWYNHIEDEKSQNNSSGGKVMAYKIDADTCISCGACAADCPVDAISEGDAAYVIDADTCIECGACAATCPVGAPAAE